MSDENLVSIADMYGRIRSEQAIELLTTEGRAQKIILHSLVRDVFRGTIPSSSPVRLLLIDLDYSFDSENFSRQLFPLQDHVTDLGQILKSCFHLVHPRTFSEIIQTLRRGWCRSDDVKVEDERTEVECSVHTDRIQHQTTVPPQSVKPYTVIILNGTLSAAYLPYSTSYPNGAPMKGRQTHCSPSIGSLFDECQRCARRRKCGVICVTRLYAHRLSALWPPAYTENLTSPPQRYESVASSLAHQIQETTASIHTSRFGSLHGKLPSYCFVYSALYYPWWYRIRSENWLSHRIYVRLKPNVAESAQGPTMEKYDLFELKGERELSTRKSETAKEFFHSLRSAMKEPDQFVNANIQSNHSSNFPLIIDTVAGTEFQSLHRKLLASKNILRCDSENSSQGHVSESHIARLNDETQLSLPYTKGNQNANISTSPTFIAWEDVMKGIGGIPSV